MMQAKYMKLFDQM